MMRRVVLAAIVLGGITISVAAQQAGRGGGPAFPPVTSIAKVRDNLYVVQGGGGNTAVFVMASGVALVDTKLAGNGQAILDQVRKVTNRPVTTIVNTHTHGDHTGSNGFFPASVEIVVHENTRANMAKMEELKATPTAMPDRTYTDRLTLGSGADRIDLYHFGAGHTNGDTFVVFPSVRTMHAGDFFPWKAPPFIDAGNGGSGVAYPATLDRVVKEVRNVDAVITGHMSTVQRWADLVEFGEFTREFLRATENAHHAGRTAQQAATELKLPAKFDSYLGDQPIVGLDFLGTGRSRARTNVEVIYGELNKR
jgi:glyoxylase-like metal-dependent hydrolase (beta-lactamase superfamily II)